MVHFRRQFCSYLLSYRRGDCCHSNVCVPRYHTPLILIFGFSLSWADTMASTFGRMFGPLTPPLPPRLPFLRLPFAPRKSLAGFMAASVTGACAAIMFWGWIGPLRHNGADLSWTWQDGVRRTSSLLGWLGMENSIVGAARGWLGLGAIGIVAGLVSGVAEALGNFPSSFSILR